jgi:hypothetical protein
MLDEPTTGPTSPRTHRDDRSMQLVEYALALVAVAAALLLAFVR